MIIPIGERCGKFQLGLDTHFLFLGVGNRTEGTADLLNRKGHILYI